MTPTSSNSESVTVGIPGIHVIRIRRRLSPIASENARAHNMSKTEYLSTLVAQIADQEGADVDPIDQSPMRVDVAVDDERWKKANIIAVNRGFRTLADMVSAMIEADWANVQHHVETP